jgi:hypothetical protein
VLRADQARFEKPVMTSEVPQMTKLSKELEREFAAAVARD